MRVGILSRELRRRPTGVGWHLARLLDQLARIDTTNEYILIHWSPRPEGETPDAAHPLRAFVPDAPNFQSVIVHGTPVIHTHFRDAYLKHILPRKLKTLGLDLVHGPAQRLPASHGPPQLVTVHDLANARMPYQDRSTQAQNLRSMRLALQHADRVIALSRFTQDELVRGFGVAKDKVRVIYEGGPDDPFRNEVLERASQTSDGETVPVELEKPYVLYVGAIEPRRNLRLLIEAFAKMKQRVGADYELVLVGRAEPSERQRLMEHATRLGTNEQVVFTGYQPPRAVGRLYAGASAFVLPALHEGFGLMVLEAMHYGVPVVAAEAGALPEVVGDAGLLVDPADPSGLAEVMHRVVTDGPLALELVQRGEARVRRFSWRRMAEQTLELYEQVAQQTPKH